MYLNDDVRCLLIPQSNYVWHVPKEGKGTLTLSSCEIGLKYSYVTPERSFAKDLEDTIALGDVSQSSFYF
jgi:phage head maturation protease